MRVNLTELSSVTYIWVLPQWIPILRYCLSPTLATTTAQRWHLLITRTPCATSPPSRGSISVPANRSNRQTHQREGNDQDIEKNGQEWQIGQEVPIGFGRQEMLSHQKLFRDKFINERRTRPDIQLLSAALQRRRTLPRSLWMTIT